MSEVMDVINAFGNPLKVAWVVWLAWGVGQYFWLRHERSSAKAAPRAAASSKPSVNVKPAPKKAAKPTTYPVETPVMGRLITPHHVESGVKPEAPRVEPVAHQPVPVAAAPVMPPAAPGAFDPSKAVIETFSGTTDGALDKFVRDFEMQDARPRRHRAPAETPSYGAGAPPTQ